MGKRLGVSEDYLATGHERDEEGASLVEAEIALRLDERELARKLFNEVLERATARDERARALGGLGQLAFIEGRPREAINRLEEVRAILGGIQGADVSFADTLGRAYAMIDQLDAAVDIFRASLTAAEERNDSVEAVRFAVLLANAYIDKAEFTKA